MNNNSDNYVVVGGYRVSNKYPCFLRLIYKKADSSEVSNKKYYIQIEDGNGKLKEYLQIEDDFSDDSIYLVKLPENRHKNPKGEVWHGFAVSQDDIIIEPLTVFVKKLNILKDRGLIKSKVLSDKIQDYNNDVKDLTKLNHTANNADISNNQYKKQLYAKKGFKYKSRRRINPNNGKQIQQGFAK